ncbi:hypothetical protein AB6A40_001548 [Gnathostoma spinigerum]|uniref:Uncharacterized protein n=1 Tax=Gnathostoma spinigerum TaxID=75299 RepID=A0ABD6EBW4_9BILA
MESTAVGSSGSVVDDVKDVDKNRLRATSSLEDKSRRHSATPQTISNSTAQPVIESSLALKTISDAFVFLADRNSKECSEYRFEQID